MRDIPFSCWRDLRTRLPELPFDEGVQLALPEVALLGGCYLAGDLRPFLCGLNNSFVEMEYDQPIDGMISALVLLCCDPDD